MINDSASSRKSTVDFEVTWLDSILSISNKSFDIVYAAFRRVNDSAARDLLISKMGEINNRANEIAAMEDMFRGIRVSVPVR